MAAFELVRGAVSSVKTKLRKRNSSDFFRYTAAGESEGALRRRSIVPSKLAHDLGDSVISTAFSDDDLLYAAGCTNKVAKVWERASGKEIASFQAAAAITAVVFISHGGQTKLVVGTFAGQLHFFDVATQQAEQTHKFGRGDAVHCLAATSSFRTGGGGAAAWARVRTAVVSGGGVAGGGGGGGVPAATGDAERSKVGPQTLPPLSPVKGGSSSNQLDPPASGGSASGAPVLPPIGVAPASPTRRRICRSPLSSRKRSRVPTGFGGGGKRDEILLVVGGKFSHVVMYLVQYPSDAHAQDTAPSPTGHTEEAAAPAESEVG